MKNINDLLNSGIAAGEIISTLKRKTVAVPPWGGHNGLQQEYDPRNHPVMDKSIYPDIVSDEGVERVTRITCDLQRLATKRMTELVCGTPVKRVYKAATEQQKEVAAFLEAIYERNRIDSVNVERCNLLYAGCEVLTLWYAVESPNAIYGFDSQIKLRCRNFSPMLGDELYPLFDEYGDMVAMSVGYRRDVDKRAVEFFDTYTENRHLKWSAESGNWSLVEDEVLTLGKIPAVYTSRPAPIWEDTSRIIYEIEWALSRNGNYLRKNSKPLFIVFADEQISYGDEKSGDKEFRSVMQYPKGSTAQYVTWPQATDSLKFYIEQLRQMFFTQLQLPDWSYEKMSQQALSGESRKQLFIDSQMKVKDESGRLLEFFDRETNVLKAFLKVMLGEKYHKDIDALSVETIITPFSISEEKETIDKLVTANGGKPIISQRESIEQLGWSADPDKTLREISDESKMDDWGLAE